jgi:hypothetical protein
MIVAGYVGQGEKDGVMQKTLANFESLPKWVQKRTFSML